ncbi:hypothetical protein C8R45DRAFT_814758 [Mycena sanguinolenta]|nr:hypothetical protein C8R45DRAFT_814758 [Mycena sanguinolenta]
MSKERQRVVHQEWVRDPSGKLLEKPPPRGSRTENNIIWGHTLEDFYWISRIPGVNVLTIWSRSMIEEYGENYLNVNGTRTKGPEPRRLHPWPRTMSMDVDEQEQTDAAPVAHAEQTPAQTRGAEAKEVGADAKDADPPQAEEGSGEAMKSNDGAACEDMPRMLFTRPLRMSIYAHTCLDPATNAASAPEAPAEATARDAHAPKVQDGAPCAEGVQAATAEGEAKVATEPAAAAEPTAVQDGAPCAEKTQAAPAATAEATDRVAATEPTTFEHPPFFHDLPTLEEFIPDEYFPDILYVNDPDNHTAMEYYCSRYEPHKPQSVEPVPRKYKRLPAPPTGSTSALAQSSSSPPAVNTNPNLRIARLNLSSAPILGTGNHSVVCRVALRLPPPLSASAARSPTGEVAVAAKMAFSGVEARRLLHNEGKMYDAFPKHLQEDWCGLNLVAPITHPVPVGAVVPKFYGYYEPVSDPVAEAAHISRDFMQTSSYRAWRRMSPILLLEECGKPIQPEGFTPDERSECYSLALRLHFAEFTQNSFYVRNILRQPGPLTVAPSARSDKTPSFRIIDHGRGEHWPLMLEAAKKEIEIEQRRRKERKAKTASMNVPTEAEMKMRVANEKAEEKHDKETLEAATKKWWESRDYEVRKAHSELQIPDFDY